MCIFFADLCITVSTILKFNKRLKIMDEMAATIHRLSDEIGVGIYENVTGVLEKSEEFQENHAELIDKLAEKKDSIKDLPEAAKNMLEEKKRQHAELSEKYDRLFEEKSFGFKRLIQAFPDMTSKDNNEMLQSFKDHFNIKKRRL